MKCYIVECKGKSNEIKDLYIGNETFYVCADCLVYLLMKFLETFPASDHESVKDPKILFMLQHVSLENVRNFDKQSKFKSRKRVRKIEVDN